MKYILTSLGDIIEVEKPSEINEYGYTNLAFILDSPNFANLEKIVLDNRPPAGSILKNGYIVQKQETQKNIPLEIVQKRLSFWNEIFIEFLGENTKLNLSSKQVKAHNKKFEPIFSLLSKTAIETALDDLKVLGVDEIFTQERKDKFILKRQNFLTNEKNDYNLS